MDVNPTPDGQYATPTMVVRTKAARVSEKRIVGGKVSPLTLEFNGLRDFSRRFGGMMS